MAGLPMPRFWRRRRIRERPISLPASGPDAVHLYESARISRLAMLVNGTSDGCTVESEWKLLEV